MYEGFPLHEDGIGMARSFEREFAGEVSTPIGPRAGFFHWVDGAPAEGYRAPRGQVTLRPRRTAPVAVLTGTYGASVLAPLLEGRDDVRVLPVENRFFGGNIGVTGLMVDEGAPDQIAEALVRLWSEPGLAERLRRAAAEMVEREHTREASARAFAELYARLATRSPARR